MKELQEIIKKVENFLPNERAVVATVVSVEGSSYRRAGARMLITETGDTLGTVSGGCLEADVLEHAKKVLQTGKARIITYDTTKNEDSVFGTGIGCRGVIKILLETTENNMLFAFVRDCFRHRETGLIATLIEKPEESASEIGAKLFFNEAGITDNFCHSNFIGDSVIDDLSFDIWQNLQDTDQTLLNYETQHGIVTFFVEKIEPPLALFIFGAGRDAAPIVNLGKHLGWRILLIDHREAWATRERFPNADEVIVSRLEDLPDLLFEDENTAAVVMTHNYELDKLILPRLLGKNFQYVGILGPKKRTERIIEESGEIFTNKQLSRLHAPIGLDIGAETPEQIALSILAEIYCALNQRNGGFLHARNAGIH